MRDEVPAAGDIDPGDDRVPAVCGTARDLELACTLTTYSSQPSLRSTQAAHCVTNTFCRSLSY